MCKINDFLPNPNKTSIIPMDDIAKLQETIETVRRMQCYIDTFRGTLGVSFQYEDVTAYLKIQLSSLNELETSICAIRANILFLIPELDGAPKDPRIYGDIPSRCDNCD